MQRTHEQQRKRKRRIRAKVIGTREKPRLCVFRSNKAVSVQLIDDTSGKTLMTVTQKHEQAEKQTGKIGIAHSLGILVAKKAKDMKITTVVFDKGSYAYHGRIKALAEGAREGGLVL